MVSARLVGLMRYVELRAHTAFSFGDGAVTPEALVSRAARLGYEAIGITDTADLGGIVRAKVAADEHGIKLIAGTELRVDGRPMAFLARDIDGCRNLASLITHARVGSIESWSPTNRQRRRGMPSVSWSHVADHTEGLHLLTGPASGALAHLVREGRRDEAKRTLHEWREAFSGRIAVEVQRHRGCGDESALAGALVDLATTATTPWVVCNDPRYLGDNSRLIHDMLTALRAGLDLDRAAERGLLHPNGEWHLRSPDTMLEMWAGLEEGIEESGRIASECDFSVRWLRPPLPAFPIPDDADADEYLRVKVYEGATTRWGATLSDRQCAQLEHELGVIRRLGFAGFFLVMWDAVRFARSKNILCQGRGSAASSAVAYCLGVTAVDPILNGLLFERFLSEARVPGPSGEYTEAPDIDLDIEHDRREEVLNYVYGKYHREHSAITCTVQTYRAPNAILDAMRALGYPVELGLELSKRLHRFDPEAGATKVRGALAAQFGVDLTGPRGLAILTAMSAFEGLPRMRSTHVGGFVLSRDLLGDYLPIEHTSMGRTIIQFDKDDLDYIGMPKFDFLGLGALALVRRAFDSIETRSGRRLELYELPQDDAPTFDMISSGETIGTFQIESRAQIASILNTRPQTMYDIVVQISLIRPGPIQGEFVHPYTRRRRGLETPSYAHPALEPILRRTYGIPIFQEQAMAISSVLGGFTPPEADRLRRTMGNIRKKTRLENVLVELTDRMVNNPVPDPPVSREVAEQISRDLSTFANYGFPESHAWSFALIAYATAYLKCHYATDFYLGLLNAQPMGFYPNATIIHEARRRGVEVRPPCLRDGRRICTTEDTAESGQPALRIGWRHIRSVGERTLDRLSEAQDFLPFTSIADVVERVGLTRAESLQLARAAAFGAWEPDRRRAAWEALRAVGDNLPFAPAHRFRYDPRELDERELIFLDYQATGICVTGHPMEHVRERLDRAGIVRSRDIQSLRDGQRVVIAGLVTVRQRPGSAKGTIFILLEDEWGFVNVIVSPRLVDRYNDIVKYARFIVVEGRFERDGGVTNVVGRRFRELAVEQLVYGSHDFH
ncbi:MAG TPA: error-prone DNA polymerase [Gemmatimonadaceae bacterium]|nr:error-prone DNA polymerase [Gemmatimonadaceae bacterium]